MLEQKCNNTLASSATFTDHDAQTTPVHEHAYTCSHSDLGPQGRFSHLQWSQASASWQRSPRRTLGHQLLLLEYLETTAHHQSSSEPWNPVCTQGLGKPGTAEAMGILANFLPSPLGSWHKPKEDVVEERGFSL